MPKIFGVEIKNVKSRTDHEGCQIHSGTIYMDGKKIGTWEDSYMSGPPDYNIPDEDWKALVERADRFYGICKGDHDYSLFKGDPDILIADLVELKEQERMYAQCLKNGFGTMIIIAGAYGMYSALYVRYKVDDWETQFQKEIEDASKGLVREYGKPLKMKYITSMDDFIVPETATEFTW